MVKFIQGFKHLRIHSKLNSDPAKIRIAISQISHKYTYNRKHQTEHLIHVYWFLILTLLTSTIVDPAHSHEMPRM